MMETSTPARKVRMWSEVPEGERATDADIVAAWEGMSPHYRDRERARLTEPRPCKAASRGTGRLSQKWLPCGKDPIDGADLCAIHGGPKRPKKVPQWKQQAALIWDEAYERGWFDALEGKSGEIPNPYRTGS